MVKWLVTFILGIAVGQEMKHIPNVVSFVKPYSNNLFSSSLTQLGYFNPYYRDVE